VFVFCEPVPNLLSTVSLSLKTTHQLNHRKGNQAAAQKFLAKASESAKKVDQVAQQYDQAFDTNSKIRKLNQLKK
jgi:hypothetical protein